MSSIETQMSTLKLTTPQLKEAARCESCDQHTYLECRHCYCVLNYEGQIHNCPVREKNPAVVRPVICDRCDECEWC